MEKVTLKLYEFYNLDVELNGLVNQQKGERVLSGLLQEKLSMVTKYWLSDLAKKVATEKATIDELKNDLIKKYGIPDGQGGITIPPTIDELDADGKPLKDLDKDGNWFTKQVPNTGYIEFQKEFDVLLNQEREVEHKSFNLTDFENVETSQNYNTFFKLVKVEETPVVPMN